MKYTILALALLVSTCTPKINTDVASSVISDEPDQSCVAGYVETSPGKGTLDIYFPTDFSPNIQSIEGVSIEVAKEVTEELGTC